jgi:alpha-ketoglutarate-dependent taurine dioxygenase
LQCSIFGLTSSGIYRSAHKYKDENNPDAEPTFVTRVHPLIRTNAATGWKALWSKSAVDRKDKKLIFSLPLPVNQAMTVGIEGFDKPESDALLNYLYGVYERSTDIQIRFHWTPGTSAIWDNRSTIHTVSYDYDGERHVSRAHRGQY